MSDNSTEDIRQRAQPIRLLLSDVDGVLTDGKLIYSEKEVEAKEFHVRDGLAVKLWRSCGLPFGLITARKSAAVSRRAEELKVDYLVQNQPDKLDAVTSISDSTGIPLSEICYFGDDLHDARAIRSVGFGATVSDAAPEIRSLADFQTDSTGGNGALRELVEYLLKVQNRWEEAIQPLVD